MNMAQFCVVAPCSLVEVYRSFRGACCLHHYGDETTSEMSINFYQTARRNNPEDSHLISQKEANEDQEKAYALHALRRDGLIDNNL
jgi:hypothetical protein